MTEPKDQDKLPDFDLLSGIVTSIEKVRAEIAEASNRRLPAWAKSGLILASIPLLGYGMAFTFACAYFGALGVPQYFAPMNPRFLYLVSLKVVVPFFISSGVFFLVEVYILDICLLKWNTGKVGETFVRPDLADLFLLGIIFSSGLLLSCYGRSIGTLLNCLFAIAYFLFFLFFVRIISRTGNLPVAALPAPGLSAVDLKEKFQSLSTADALWTAWAIIAKPLVNAYESLERTRPTYLKKRFSLIGCWFIFLVGICVFDIHEVSKAAGEYEATHGQGFLVFRTSNADMVVLDKVENCLLVAPLDLKERTFKPIYRFVPIPSDGTTTFTLLRSALKIVGPH